MSYSQRVVLLTAVLMAVALVLPASAAFTYSKSLTITTPGDFDRWYYQINLTLHNTTGINSGPDVYTNGSTLPTWSDIQFYSVDRAEIPFFVDKDPRRGYTSTSVQVWVNVPRINQSGSNNKIYLAYSDAAYTISASDADKTLLLWDDFDGSSLNKTKWDGLCTAYTSSYCQVSGSVYGYGILSNSTPPNGSPWVDFNLSATYNTTYNCQAGGYCALWHLGTDTSFAPKDSAGTYACNANQQPYTSSDGGGPFWATLFGGGGGLSCLDYHTQTIQLNWTTYIHSVDSVPMANVTGAGVMPRSDSLSFAVSVNDVGTIYTKMDYVMVRNFTVPEPDLGVWADDVPASTPPVAAFSCIPRVGTVHFDVACTDSSTNAPTSWYWEVQNGSVPITFTVKNPIFNITWPNQYDINLLATNVGGEDWENKSAYIIARNAVPAVDFSGTPTTVNLSTDVTFTDLSTGTNITGWNWSFSDGNFSDLQNPTNRFPTTGRYAIYHNATDSDRTPWNVSATTRKPAYIHVINNTPNNTFYSDVQSGNVPLTVTFTEASNQTIENYTWLFGDEFTDRNQTPIYIFKNTGTFSVNYSVCNYENCVWFNRSNFITMLGPVIPAPDIGTWTTGKADDIANLIIMGIYIVLAAAIVSYILAITKKE